MDYIIETENLTKRYGTATVVDKVNLHVPKGKIYGLLGRNGAGKTTAMKMMLQLAFPTEGTVRLFGTNYKENIHTLYSKVGSIIETPGFYSNLTGYENLQILAKLRGGVSKSGVEKSATRQAAIYTVGCNGQNSDGSAYTPRRRYSASCRRR